MITSRSAVLLALSVSALAGCVTPHVVSYYDDQCQVMARRVELSVTQVQVLGRCDNAGCSAEALGAIVLVATSAIVSGSVAVVGNVAYWAEKTRNCRRALPPASAPTPTPTPPTAVTPPESDGSRASAP